MRHRALLAAPSCALLAAGLAAWSGAWARSTDRVDLAPKFKPGQVLRYSIDYETETHGDTESVIIDPLALRGARVKARGVLRVEVVEVQPEGSRRAIKFRTSFDHLDSTTDLFGPVPEETPQQAQKMSAEGKRIEFTLGAGGKIRDVDGLDALNSEQQRAWQDWLEQFAALTILPSENAKRGQKWQTEQTEGTPSILTGLVWVRNTGYVRDEPCRAVNLDIRGEAQPAQKSEICAVFLSRETLVQKSSPKDATPEAFRLRDLRTSGTAHGSSETITYVSLGTGIVVRSTTSGQQNLDVTVAKADRSNQVRHKVDVKSRSSIQLVADTPLVRP